MRLALGTAQFGLHYGIANHRGQVLFEDARAILESAKRSGIDTVDTASSYGDCEATLGRIGVAGWRVISKLPADIDERQDISEWTTRSVQASLARLNVSSLYALLLHRPLQLISPRGDALYRRLLELKDTGSVEKIGISVYEPADIEAVFSRFGFDLVQAPLNILDRRLLASGWLQRLKDRGIEVHARSVFLQGLLLMESDSRPSKFNRWSSIWASYHSWLVHNRMSALEACLRFVLSFEEIDKVIVGVDSEEHLAQIVKALDGPLPDVPEGISCSDGDLLNPVRWASLS